MKPIPGVNLKNMVEQASKELIFENRKQAIGMIKKGLKRIEGLAKEIKYFNHELKKRQGKLAKSQEKINKIKDGDWSLLVEAEKENLKESARHEPHSYCEWERE